MGFTDCGMENTLKPGDVIQCRECGYRILYKKRTRRSKLLFLSSFFFKNKTKIYLFVSLGMTIKLYFCYYGSLGYSYVIIMIELNISFVFLTLFEFIHLINCKVVLIYILVGYGNRG